MKQGKHLPIQIVLIATLLFFACNGVNEQILLLNEATYIGIDGQDSIEIGYMGDESIVKIKSDGAWTITPTQNWYTVSSEQGKGDMDIVVIVSQNISTETRRDTLRIISGNIEKQLVLYQEGYLNLSIFPSAIELAEQGDESQFTVSSNTDWEIIEKPGWIKSIDKIKGESGSAVVRFTVSPNVSNDNRLGELTVISGIKKAKLSLKQATQL